MEKEMKDIFPKLMFKNSNNYVNFIMIYHVNVKE